MEGSRSSCFDRLAGFSNNIAFLSKRFSGRFSRIVNDGENCSKYSGMPSVMPYIRAFSSKEWFGNHLPISK